MRREIEYFINVRNTKGWKGLEVVLGQKRQFVLWYLLQDLSKPFDETNEEYQSKEFASI